VDERERTEEMKAGPPAQLLFSHWLLNLWKREEHLMMQGTTLAELELAVAGKRAKFISGRKR
jgi:hypothetical protein